MRVTMGLLKNEHGVYYVRKKVPKRLQEAAALVTGASKSRQTWLKQSLKTKDVREAKRLTPPVLMRVDASSRKQKHRSRRVCAPVLTTAR
jgi:hypothetical protein